mmetsp:Transcript_53577/g.160351  ORF Transcript_53577/g.160351 Transcript_53577/m.160351 type:complete len:243 (-) Transcript_53577:372-1100(-)
MRTLSTTKPTPRGMPNSSLFGCPQRRRRTPLADRRSRCRGSSSLSSSDDGNGTKGAQSALIVGVQSTGSPPGGYLAQSASSTPEMRVLPQPLTTISCLSDFVPWGADSTHSTCTLPSPSLLSSVKSISARVAGTPQTSSQTCCATSVLTYSFDPHCPRAPRFETSAPMVTYSKYGPTGLSSYSRATTPPTVHPKRERMETEGGGGGGSLPSTTAPAPASEEAGFGTRTRAGRNQSRPVNCHG